VQTHQSGVKGEAIHVRPAKSKAPL